MVEDKPDAVSASRDMHPAYPMRGGAGPGCSKRERVPTSFTVTAVPVDSIAVGLALIRRRRRLQKMRQTAVPKRYPQGM